MPITVLNSRDSMMSLKKRKSLCSLESGEMNMNHMKKWTHWTVEKDQWHQGKDEEGCLIQTDDRAENRRMNESVLGKRLRGRLKGDSW